MTQKTTSESFFEQFCTQHGVRWEPIATEGTTGVKTPDYAIFPKDTKVITEIKEIRENAAERQQRKQLAEVGWSIFGERNVKVGDRARDIITTAAKQLRRLAKGRLPAMIVIYNRLAEMNIPLFVRMQEPGWPQPMEVWNPQVPQFSVGTEFALLRKMVLPDRDGHLRLTPVTESVQIRHYTDIPSVNPMASRDVNLARRFQEPSEIELSRVLLFSAHHSGLRGVTASDDPFLIFPSMSQGDDAFEEGRTRVRAISPFVECTSCHLGPGIQSMMSFSFRGNPNEGTVLSPRLAETTPREETEKVMEWAQRQEKWKDFLRLWSSAIPN